MASRVYVITGLPASGKTTIARGIAAHFRVASLSKDAIKERLFDSLGSGDRESSKAIGRAAYDLLYASADELLKAGSSFVIEANFDPRFADEVFAGMKARHGATFVQILCWADGNVLFERFKERASSGERHAGHADADSLEEFRPVLAKGRIEPLHLDGPLFEIDTTDFTKVDMGNLLRAIEDASQ